MLRLRTLVPLLTASAAVLCSPVQAATFTWRSVTDFWSVPGNWTPTGAPTGLNNTDILQFTGTVNLGTWTASNDIRENFLLNRLIFGVTGSSFDYNVLDGMSLRLSGASPQLLQNGTVGAAIENKVQFDGSLAVGGTGNGPLFLRGGLSGNGNITKTGPSTLYFGSPTANPNVASDNTWMGALLLQAGGIQFESNSAAGGALRANPIVFTGNTSVRFTRTDGLTPASLRFGTLNGATGTLQASVQGQSLENYNVIITALTNGNFGGAFLGPVPADPINDPGELIVRGPGSQRFSGTISTFKDVVVGAGGTMILSGTATLSSQTQGAITMAGGNFVLDNTAGNVTEPGRLRNSVVDSTGLEAIGGGKFQLIGNIAGTSETMGRLQLGSKTATGDNKRRSGHLVVEAVHQAAATGATELKFQNYTRDEESIKQYATIDFAAKTIDAQGNLTAATLGQAGANPRIFLHTSGVFDPALLRNGLLTTTGTAVGLLGSVGWATVNGSDFASYNNATGVVAASTSNWTTTVTPVATANALVTASVTTPTPATGYAINSIKMEPVTVGQSINISGAGHLSSTAFLLAGAIDFAINNTSTGGISGTNSRFFHVQQAVLTVNASLAGAILPVVKSGEGTLALTNVNNINVTGAAVHTSLNGGILRATPGSTLPNAELRIRGGQLEIPAGGTVAMTLGTGAGALNWTNVTNTGLIVEQDKGSGGISAFNNNLTFNLNLAPGVSTLRWEDPAFVGANYELIFGSKTSNAQLTWTRPFSLTEGAAVPVYNARVIRVLDNPASANDWTRLSGSISGQKQSDLVKAGPGMLELTAVNLFEGATIVQEGTLAVNSPGSTVNSFLHDVMNGATLAGNGNVGSVRVEGGGTLSPGSLAGRTETLNIGNTTALGQRDLTFLDSTSRLVIEIGGTNVGSSTSGYDRVNISGTVNLSNASLVASFVNGYTGGPDALFIILNDGSDAVQGKFITGDFVSVGDKQYALTYTADSTTSDFNSLTGNDVAMILVPEPSSALLLGAGALLVARRRRTARK